MRHSHASIAIVAQPLPQPQVAEPTIRYDLKEAARNPERLLRLPEVIRRTGMCRSKIYILEGFPKPVKVAGRTSAWIESEVDAWIAQVIAEGRQRRCA